MLKSIDKLILQINIEACRDDITEMFKELDPNSDIIMNLDTGTFRLETNQGITNHKTLPDLIHQMTTYVGAKNETQTCSDC